MIELVLFVAVAGAALFIGLFIYQRPQKAFDLQKKFGSSPFLVGKFRSLG